MSAGFLDLQKMFGGSPMDALAQTAQADPATTGAIPPPAAMPAPAPAAAPQGDFLSGIGNAISRGVSGQGVLNDAPLPGDDKVDPTTGATAAQMRQTSMQSLMGFGLTLLAAGQRQSDDSRAAILARAPAMLNNSDQINSFAKTRLLMSDAKLAERKQAQAEQRDAAFKSILGGGAAAGLPTGVASSTSAPIAGAAQAGAAIPGTVAPATAQPAVPTSPGAPAAAPGVLDVMSPDERAIVGALGADKGFEYLAKKAGTISEQEKIGAPYVEPTTRQLMVDVFKNGVKTGTRPLGSAASTVTEEGNKRITRQNGSVTGIADVPEDPQDREERTASVSLRKERFKGLQDSRGQIVNLDSQIPRLQAAEEAVRSGKTIQGFGADLKTQSMNILDTLGILSPEGKAALVKSGDVDGILGQAGGEFAKLYYGPGISNSDVENAKKAIGGLKTNSPDVVANSLKKIREGYETKIGQYNKDVDSHNGRLSGIRDEGLRADLTVGKIERTQPPTAAPASQPAPAASYTPDQIAAARAELARRRAAQGTTR